MRALITRMARGVLGMPSLKEEEELVKDVLEKVERMSELTNTIQDETNPANLIKFLYCSTSLGRKDVASAAAARFLHMQSEGTDISGVLVGAMQVPEWIEGYMERQYPDFPEVTDSLLALARILNDEGAMVAPIGAYKGRVAKMRDVAELVGQCYDVEEKKNTQTKSEFYADQERQEKISDAHAHYSVEGMRNHEEFMRQPREEYKESFIVPDKNASESAIEGLVQLYIRFPEVVSAVLTHAANIAEGIENFSVWHHYDKGYGPLIRTAEAIGDDDLLIAVRSAPSCQKSQDSE